MNDAQYIAAREKIYLAVAAMLTAMDQRDARAVLDSKLAADAVLDEFAAAIRAECRLLTPTPTKEEE